MRKYALQHSLHVSVVVVGSFELSFDVNIREITFVKLKYYLI